MSEGDAAQVVTSSTPNLVMCNGSSTHASSKEQAGNASASESSNVSGGGFSSSSVSTVINVLKPLVTETTKSLFSFGNTAVSPSVNATTGIATTRTSNSALKPEFTVNHTQAAVGLYGSPTAAANGSGSTEVTLFGSAKSDYKPSMTLPSGTQSFRMKPVTSSSVPFQSNATSNSIATNSVGGFKFDFTKGKKENEVASTTVFQTVNLMASTTAPITTTSAITSIPTTTSVTISAPSTSQSESPLKFGTPVSTPMFNFSGTSTANGPTQSTGGFPGVVFGNSQPKTDGVTEKSQKSPFTFGAVSSSQSQSLTGTVTFGSSSTLSGVKSGSFVFGGSGQPTSGVFGSGGNTPGQAPQSGGGNMPDQASQPVFGGGGNKTDQSQPGSGIFGAVQSSNRVFGGTQVSQPAGGLFGRSVTQSSGIFGSSINMSTPSMQPSGGMFGSSGTLSVQSSQPSAGLFGSPSPQTSQPSGAVLRTPTQPGDGIFGCGSNVTTQPAGGAFGGGGSTQPVFGFGSTSPATPAQETATGGSTGLFGATTPFQFGAGSSSAAALATQPTGMFHFSVGNVLQH